jgi:hypothetical protein
MARDWAEKEREMIPRGQRTTVVVIAILAAAAGSPVGMAADGPAPVAWNDKADSIVLNKTALTNLGDGFPAWEIKQMTWPSEAERRAAAVSAKDAWTAECLKWLGKFFKENYLPADVGKHLVAMRAWGTVRKEAGQPRLCDVFVVRFRKGPYLIHVQESPCNVVITVADEDLARKKAAGEDVAKAAPKELVIQMAQAILNKVLWPDQAGKYFRQSPDRDLKIGKLSTFGWLPPSAVRQDEQGRLIGSGVEEEKLGTMGAVTAETDGSFVRFEIVKYLGGPRSYEDPYQNRFAPEE